MRRTDPVARRLLADVLALEGSPWPASRPVYAAALLRLAARCERVEARAEIYKWAMVEFGGFLMHRRAVVRECRTDALADMAAEMSGTLLRFRAGLDDARRPNLRSMIRASIIWRAGDMIESRFERHSARMAPELRDGDRPAHHRSDARTLANEVLALLSGDGRTSRALRLVGLGYSVTEAARRTGASRQQVYRARDALRSLVDDDPSEG